MPVVGISLGMERERQQNDSLVNGYPRPPRGSDGTPRSGPAEAAVRISWVVEGAEEELGKVDEEEDDGQGGEAEVDAEEGEEDWRTSRRALLFFPLIRASGKNATRAGGG